MTALAKTWTLDADFDSGTYFNAQAVDDAVEIIDPPSGTWTGTYDPGSGTRPEWQLLTLHFDFAGSARAYVRFRATGNPGHTGDPWVGDFFTQQPTTTFNLRLPDSAGNAVRRKRYFEVTVVLQPQSGTARLLDATVNGVGSTPAASPGDPVLIEFSGASGAFAGSVSSAGAVSGESSVSRPTIPTVLRAHNPVPTPDGGGNSDWFETFTPGTLDVWTAVRMQGGDLQIEYQITCRSAVTIGTLTIVFAGYGPLTIPVRRVWPAGRSLSGRLGPEMSLAPEWDDANTGPLNMPLGAIDDQSAVNANYVAGLAALRACIALGRSGHATAHCELEETTDGIGLIVMQGDPPVPVNVAPWEGPFACWGSRDGGLGSPGGDGIYHPWGWQNSVEYARYACEASAVAMTRQWVCVKSTGAHASVDDYLPGITPDVNDQTMQRLAGWTSGEDLAMHPQQLSHYVRVLRYVGAAWEMTRSPLAKRQLIQMAEMARLMFTESGTINYDPSFIGNNFSTIERATYYNFDGSSRNIHEGTLIGVQNYAWQRQHGWAMYTAAAAKKAGMAWTTGWQDWAQRVIDALSYSQMPNGILAATLMPDWATLIDPVLWPATATIQATMHEAILGIGLAALGVQTGITPSHAVSVSDMSVANATALYNNANPGMIQVYFGGYGPWHWIRVGTNDGASPSLVVSVAASCSTGYAEATGPSNPGDPAHAESYIAVMHELTADSVWLDRSILFGNAAIDIATKKANILADHTLSGADFVSRNWTMWLLGQYP